MRPAESRERSLTIPGIRWGVSRVTSTSSGPPAGPPGWVALGFVPCAGAPAARRTRNAAVEKGVIRMDPSDGRTGGTGRPLGRPLRTEYIRHCRGCPDGTGNVFALRSRSADALASAPARLSYLPRRRGFGTLARLPFRLPGRSRADDR